MFEFELGAFCLAKSGNAQPPDPAVAFPVSVESQLVDFGNHQTITHSTTSGVSVSQSQPSP